MATSLAEQLRKLAVPQTTLLTRDKKRPSLLFDPKEAANLDKATVYQIGLDGLEELKARNMIFEQFELTLFHPSSQQFERAVETAESNQLLNNNIKKFLLLVSPYFLFSCSYKALEWLVYRYHINDYNKEDILMLILPYHETNIFVRALQLLNLNEPNDKWGWLKSLQRPGIHLPKQTLYNHAASDLYFVQFVSNFVLAMTKEHENPANLVVVFNFYCTTLLGALEFSREINEGHVSQMLPVVLQGLHSEIPDFAAATYVICAKLVIKTQLTDKILQRFVERISEMKVSTLTKEATLLLVVLYQSQKQFKTISELSLKQLSEREGFLKALQGLSSDGVNILPFLEVLFSSVIKAEIDDGNGEYGRFAEALLDQIKIEDTFVEVLFSIILDIYKPNKNQQSPWLKTFIAKIERQYPQAYDATIKKLTKSSDKLTSLKKKKTLGKLIDNLSNLQDWYEIFEKLYHPTLELRREGLRILNEKFYPFRNNEKDDVLQNVLIDRLNDDKRKVVHDTLTMFKFKLGEVIDSERLRDNLTRLLSKCQTKGKKWVKTAQVVLDVLCHYFKGDDVRVFVAVLPFLCPLTDEEMATSKNIIQSNFGKTSVFKDVTCGPTLFKQILSNKAMRGNLPEITRFINGLPNNDELNAVQKYLIMLLMAEVIPEQAGDVNNLILDVFQVYLKSSEVVSMDAADMLDCVRVARDGKLPQRGFLGCLEELMRKTKAESDLARLDLTDASFYVRVLGILAKSGQLSLGSRTLDVYVERFCQGSVEFFFNVAISGGENDIDCLKLANLMLREQNEVELVVPYVMVAMCCSKNKVRKVAMGIVGRLSERDSPYKTFLEALLKSREEIVLDHDQAPLVMFNLTSNPSFRFVLKLLKQTLAGNYPMYFKSGIITLLSLVNDSDMYEGSANVALAVLHGKTPILNTHESDVMECNVQRFNVDVASYLVTESKIWTFLQASLKSNKRCGKMTVSVLALNQIDRLVFAALPQRLQDLLLDLVTEIATVSDNPEVTQACSHLFKRIDLDASLILPQLVVMRDVQSVKSPVTGRKRQRRVNVVPTVDILSKLEWKKGVNILENIQAKKKMRNVSTILGVLFDILKRCLDFDEQAVVEYPKQLVLSTILHCCDRGETLPKNAFNMQLVVQCIRASQNPQTHHHALLLLAQTASIIPKQVLHNIISIFTFVGSSVLRHDDAYSFQIITKIIDTVIPILIRDGSIESQATVLRVFADALIDIPEHRRLPLFTQLLTCLDSQKTLYVLLLIIFEGHVVHSNEKQPDNYIGPKRLDIASDLASAFPPDCVLTTCIRLVEYLLKLPEEKDNKIKRVDTFTFNVERYTSKQFRHYKYTIVTFMAGLLASPAFVKKVAKLSDDSVLTLEDTFKTLILNVLNYIQDTLKISERNVNSGQAQYWKVMLHHDYDVLDAINALLSSQMFLLVIRGLMVYSLSNVRKRALDLLINKLQHNPGFFNDCDNQLYDVIVTPLITIIKSNDSDNDSEIVAQKALVCLKLLVKRLASANIENFIPVLDIVCELIRNKRQENLLASLILCIAELCANLKAHSISALHRFMPSLIKLLKTQKRLDSPNLLLITIMAALHKILDCLALFLSPYVEKLLGEIALIATKWPTTTDDTKLTPFYVKLEAIQNKIGSAIPLRVLLPAVRNAFASLIAKQKYSATRPLMMILSQNLTDLKPIEIQGALPELTVFFLDAFEMSGRNAEDHLIGALVKLVLKLSETTFRPLYYKLFDWAVRSPDSKSERVITFYSMSYAFADNLKGLFVLFAGHFLNNAASLLDACNSLKNSSLYFEDDSKNSLLLDYILKTLQTIFTYNSHKFVNKERFDILMQPIVDQLENTLGGIDALQTRVKETLTPCIVQFAAATADDSLWKQMNYQMLLKMRHDSAMIRLLSLECFGETAKKLGEDFLPLLPETIPFLAELLEDEDELVEKACRKTVQELEKLLGEPLQKYF